MSYKVKIELDGFRCLRCGYEWVPRVFKQSELPTICPKCKSPYWNKERRQPLKRNNEADDTTKDAEDPPMKRVSQPRR